MKMNTIMGLCACLISATTALRAQENAQNPPPEPVRGADQTRSDGTTTVTDPLHKDFLVGLDLSHHSGAIDWERLKAEGVHFVYLKATEGEDFVDPSFAEAYAAAKKTGIPCGAYHFFESDDDPERMATFFIQTARLEAGDLIPVVDIEILRRPGDGTGLAQRLRLFVQRLESHYGVKPIIYTGPSFWDQHLSDDFGDYPLWIAELGVGEPKVPKGWKTWAIWQAKENVQLAGVEKDVDLNYFRGTQTQLSNFVIHESTKQPEIQEPSPNSKQE